MNTELEQVVEKIRKVEAQLAKAEEDGLRIDNPGVVALNNKLTVLTQLLIEKNRLSSERLEGVFVIGLFLIGAYLFGWEFAESFWKALGLGLVLVSQAGLKAGLKIVAENKSKIHQALVLIFSLLICFSVCSYLSKDICLAYLSAWLATWIVEFVIACCWSYYCNKFCRT